MPPKIREPVYTPRFLADVEKLRNIVWRLDELIDAVLEVLCRTPDTGRKTNTDAVFGFPLMRLPGNPGCALYYSYNETQIIFHYLVSESEYPKDAIM